MTKAARLILCALVLAAGCRPSAHSDAKPAWDANPGIVLYPAGKSVSRRTAPLMPRASFRLDLRRGPKPKAAPPVLAPVKMDLQKPAHFSDVEDEP